jgi:hypothetical protein
MIGDTPQRNRAKKSDKTQLKQFSENPRWPTKPFQKSEKGENSLFFWENTFLLGP